MGRRRQLGLDDASAEDVVGAGAGAAAPSEPGKVTKVTVSSGSVGPPLTVRLPGSDLAVEAV